MIKELNEDKLREAAQLYTFFPISLDVFKNVSSDFIREFKTKIWWRSELTKYLYYHNNELYKELFRGK